ncbi:hypothetical protein QFC19_009255 [Naganishia cerealis]|uniref:Uncharacterized protein n=1 Tax=Naganishia cerealis TaxID=610337 RepID=A0ACC2UWT9_9TREE|nr:hypothetical protein QFC19_009255 [Naganishia cerealis]
MTVDKSVYWAPREYPDIRRDPSQPVQAFPEGFKMLAGDPNRKTPNSAFFWSCHRKADLSDEVASDNFNFDDPCVGGIKHDFTFPSCWDGVNLYKNDQSHMAYPTQSIRDGPCPASHPIRLPSILLEVTYHPETFPAITKGKNMRGNLVLANGDTTGYGLHADFIMGWDRAILTKALNDPGCVNLGHSITIQECPTLAPYFNVNAAQACKPARGQLTEPYPQGDGNILPKLPGCNPLWGATGSKPTCNPPVAGLDVSAFKSTAGPDVLPASQQYNSALPDTAGWHDIGCYSNNGVSGITYVDAQMTPERCQDACKRNGYSYAGVQVTVNETFYQAAKYVTPDTTSYDLGCYQLPNDWQSDNLVKGATYSFTSNSMTRDLCSQTCVSKGAAYSAVRDTSCYCGTNFKTGPGFYVPNDMCTRKCGGNANQICGDYYLLSVGNLANYKGGTGNSPTSTSASATPTAADPVATYVSRGCFADGSPRVLNTTSTYSFNGMSPSACADIARKAGRKLFGIEYGGECYVGDTLLSNTPATDCSTPCTSGEKGAICGGPWALSLYELAPLGGTPTVSIPAPTSAAPSTTTSAAASPTTTYTYRGCINDGTPRVLNATSTYSVNGMGPSVCAEIARKAGRKLFGIEYGGECYVGDTLLSNTPATDCSTPCTSGEKGVMCGGPWTLSLYEILRRNDDDEKGLSLFDEWLKGKYYEGMTSPK